MISTMQELFWIVTLEFHYFVPPPLNLNQCNCANYASETSNSSPSETLTLTKVFLDFKACHVGQINKYLVDCTWHLKIAALENWYIAWHPSKTRFSNLRIFYLRSNTPAKSEAIHLLFGWDFSIQKEKHLPNPTSSYIFQGSVDGSRPHPIELTRVWQNLDATSWSTINKSVCFACFNLPMSIS